jgi:hypothetical protein
MSRWMLMVFPQISISFAVAFSIVNNFGNSCFSFTLGRCRRWCPKAKVAYEAPATQTRELGLSKRFWQWLIHYVDIILAALLHPSPRKEPLVPIGQETGWATELVWTTWRREKYHLCRNTNPSLPVRSPSHMEWAIPYPVILIIFIIILLATIGLKPRILFILFLPSVIVVTVVV